MDLYGLNPSIPHVVPTGEVRTFRSTTDGDGRVGLQFQGPECTLDTAALRRSSRFSGWISQIQAGAWRVFTAFRHQKQPFSSNYLLSSSSNYQETRQDTPSPCSWPFSTLHPPIRCWCAWQLNTCTSPNQPSAQDTMQCWPVTSDEQSDLRRRNFSVLHRSARGFMDGEGRIDGSTI